MPDPLTQQAVARQQARIDRQDAAFTAQMDEAAAAIASLETIGRTASNAINNSTQDRATLHLLLDMLTTRVAALEARKLTTHTGTAAVPAIALNASSNVTITWPGPFPDDKYVCSDPVFSSALVGKATGAVTAQTKDGCTIRVNAGALIALGSTVSVVAIRLG